MVFKISNMPLFSGKCYKRLVDNIVVRSQGKLCYVLSAFLIDDEDVMLSVTASSRLTYWYHDHWLKNMSNH